MPAKEPIRRSSYNEIKKTKTQKAKIEEEEEDSHNEEDISTSSEEEYSSEEQSDSESDSEEEEVSVEYVYCTDSDCEDCKKEDKKTQSSTKNSNKKKVSFNSNINVSPPPPPPSVQQENTIDLSIIEKLLLQIHQQINQLSSVKELHTIYKNLTAIQSTKLFSKEEMDVLINIYQQKKSLVANKLETLRPSVNLVKKLWEQKKDLLSQLYDANMLTQESCQLLFKNLSQYEKMISDIDKQINPKF